MGLVMNKSIPSESDAPPSPSSPSSSTTATTPPASRSVKAMQIHEVMANIATYASAPVQVLEEAIRAAMPEAPADSSAPTNIEEMINGCNHFEVVKAWCEENKNHAGAIVLLSCYLANGRFLMQQMDQPESDAE